MEEILNILPHNWKFVRLSDICLEVEKIENKVIKKNSFTYIDINSIDNQTNRITQPKTYEWLNAPSRAKQIVKVGDILFSTVRTYLKNIASVEQKYDNQIASTGFCVIRPNSVINKKLVFYYVLYEKFLRSLNEIQRGTSYPAVRNSDVFNQIFPLIPQNEQNRIVAKIEELFNQLDAGIAELKKAQAQLKIYRQSVLKYAFEGKLTEEWRKENADKLEPASELIKRIKQEKEKQYQEACEKAEKDRKKKPQKPKELPPIDKSELGELLEGWEWIQLDNVSNKITDGEHIRPNTIEDGVPFLSAKDIRDNGVRFENPLFISIEDAKKFRQRCDPEKGDILVVSRGATVGRSCTMNTDKEFCLLGSVILIKIDKKLDSSYINYLLKSPITQKLLIELSGSTAQQAIYIRDIKNLIIPISSLEEQTQIVQEIESRLSIADHLEQSIEQSLQKAEGLRQSILKQAFEGKLVPQDPNDEPAEKLLERIKAEKENSKK